MQCAMVQDSGDSTLSYWGQIVDRGQEWWLVPGCQLRFTASPRSKTQGSKNSGNLCGKATWVIAGKPVFRDAEQTYLRSSKDPRTLGMPGKHSATELCFYPRGPHLDIGPLKLVICARPGSGAGVNRKKYIDC